MDIDRRVFLCTAAGAVGALATTACASVAATRVAASDGALRLPLRAYPALLTPGGAIRVQPEGAPTQVYILANAGDEYVALSPICTHQGCTVDLQGELLVCPCHGSTYDRSGQVLRGPAERPLARHPVQVTDDGVLVIQLTGPQ